MSFNIKTYGSVSIGGVDVWITESMLVAWLISALLIALGVYVRIKVKRFQDIPSGAQSVIESVVELFEKYVVSIAGSDLSGLASWCFSVCLFMLSAILVGLFGLRPPTADWSVAFAFAMSTFVLIQIKGVQNRKGEYIMSFFKPNFLFLPINIIGELSRPVSLSFRLFGNILSGMILMNILYNLLPVYLTILLPVPLHIFFDVIMGALQTYIFATLSLSFIRNSATGNT